MCINIQIHAIQGADNLPAHLIVFLQAFDADKWISHVR
jgi:hypothetical protein